MSKVAHAPRLTAARFLLQWSTTNKSVELLDLVVEVTERHFEDDATSAFQAIMVEVNMELPNHDPATANIHHIVANVMERMIGSTEPDVAPEKSNAFNVDTVLGVRTGEAVFVCGACKSDNVSHVPMTTRSADEDQTIFGSATTRRAKHTWRQR